MCLPGSKNITIPSDDVAGDMFDDTELEDDDDGSTTVTNSTANLADLIARPGPVSAEELAAKLESATVALIEEAKPFPEPPLEGSSVKVPSSDDSVADTPSHDEPGMDLPSDDEPAADLGTATKESAVEGLSVDICPPSEHSSDTTDTTVDPVCIDKEAVADTGLEEDEVVTVDDLSSQDDSEQDVESWNSDCEIPTIIVSPPSEVDPEDSAQQFELEDEQEESGGRDFEDGPNPEYEHEEAEYDGDSEPECVDDCPGSPVAEVVLEPPPSPVEVRDPCRSPITGTGELWSDYEGGDLGPLPVCKIAHVEVFDNLETSEAGEIAGQPETIDARDSTVEEDILDIVTATPEDSNSM